MAGKPSSAQDSQKLAGQACSRRLRALRAGERAARASAGPVQAARAEGAPALRACLIAWALRAEGSDFGAGELAAALSALPELGWATQGAAGSPAERLFAAGDPMGGWAAHSASPASRALSPCLGQGALSQAWASWRALGAQERAGVWNPSRAEALDALALELAVEGALAAGLPQFHLRLLGWEAQAMAEAIERGAEGTTLPFGTALDSFRRRPWAAEALRLAAARTEAAEIAAESQRPGGAPEEPLAARLPRRGARL